MSISKEAIELLQRSANYEKVFSELNTFDAEAPVMAVPEGFQLISLEEHMHHRSSYRFNFETSSIDDFITYCNQHAGSSSEPLCLVDGDAMKARVIFDMGTKDFPGHMRHRASLTPIPTACYRLVASFLKNNKFGQKDVSDLILDWSGYIVAFDQNGSAMPASLAAESLRTITIESAKKANSVVGDYAQKMDTMESIEADRESKLPDVLCINTRPYIGFIERTFKLKVGVLPQEGAKPLVSLRLVGFDDQKEQIEHEFKSILSDGIDDMDVLTGWIGG